jgi:predicted DNA-binding protein (MmcQ/YjbR family)
MPGKKKPVRKKRPKPKPGFRQGEAALRKYALSFPEAHEEFPWGERVIKVNKKIFVFLHGSADELSVTTKLPQSYGAALLAPFCKPTGYGLGKSGWVTATFTRGIPPSYDILKSWIDESYRAVAPKRLLKNLAE